MLKSAMRASSVGEGGAPPVATRTGFAVGAAAGWLASIVSTVGAALKWVTPSSRRWCQILPGSIAAKAEVLAARGGDRPREAPPVAVEHRQGPEEHRRGFQSGVECHRQRLEERAAVVVLDAFGPARRPARVVDGEQAELIRHRLDELAGRVEQQLVVVACLDDTDVRRGGAAAARPRSPSDASTNRTLADEWARM